MSATTSSSAAKKPAAGAASTSPASVSAAPSVPCLLKSDFVAHVRTLALGDDLERAVVAVHDLYAEDRLFLAHRALDELRVRLEAKKSDDKNETDGTSSSSSSSSSSSLSYADVLSRVPVLRSVEREVGEVREMTAQMDSDDGWQLVKRVADGSNDNHISIFYRHTPGTQIHSVKTHGRMKLPIINVLAIINEDARYTAWVPRLKFARKTAQQSRYRKVVHAGFELWWPIWPREALLYGYGVDNLEDDRLIVFVRSVDDKNDARVPADAYRDVERGHVRALGSGGFIIRALSESESEVTCVSSADPRMSAIPSWLINWATENFAHWIFQYLRDQAMRITDAELFADDNPNAHVYKDIQQRLHAHFASKRDPDATTTKH